MPSFFWRWPWISALTVVAAAAGFSKGIRAAWQVSAAALLGSVVWWMRGASVGGLAGCWSAFLAVPWVMKRLESTLRDQSATLSKQEAVVGVQVRELKKEEEVCQSKIQAGEEAVQEIGQLYELSKEFLGTLEPGQGLQVTGEFLGRWVPDLSESERENCLRQISALMETGTVSAEGLRRALPSAGGGMATRERWAIAEEQLALGLQRLCLYRRVQESATHDGLTGLLVRRYLLERLSDELNRARRRSATVVFLMVDLDRFKQVNDRYGHLVGDVVLREVAQRIRSSVREMDLVGRYGGEEFEVVLPEADAELGMAIAERIRRAVEAAPIPAYDEEVVITVSIGLALFPRDGQTSSELIERADEAMYRAKGLGRDRTVPWSVG